MKISIVTPIYKDSYLALPFIESIQKIDWLDDSLIELIFIVDGSGIQDEIELRSIAKKFSWIKVIILSRNFGQHIALSAGYNIAIGDVICMLNVDQQDPPSEIPRLLKKLENEELDIVYGLRETRKDKLMKRITSTVFNFILNKLTGDTTPLNVSTLRVMSRRFINSYNQLSEKSRYIPGLEHWLGFNKGYLLINHQERKDGKSSYNFKKRILLAVDSIISFSDLPLRLTAMIGFIIAGIGLLFLLILIIMKLSIIDFQPGYISTISCIIFIGGLQILVTGLAAIYIGRVLKEVQNRPLYIIKEKFNF